MEALTAEVLVYVVAAGFAAGFLDSIVGGGGLIMTPAMLNLFPQLPILTIIGTQRTSSIFGTSVAALGYLRVMPIAPKLLLSASLSALLCSILGVLLAKQVPPETLKWVVLVICLALALYICFQPRFGQKSERRWQGRSELMMAAIVAAGTGFYNGLIGPGTGMLMVFGFVWLLGLDFLESSAVSKVTNVAADLSSWTVLLFSGHVIWALAFPLIVGNMAGSYCGARLAILKGSRWIRWLFLFMVSALLAKLVSDLWRANA